MEKLMQSLMLVVLVVSTAAHSKMRVAEDTDGHLLRLVGMPKGQVSRKAIVKLLLPYLEKKFDKGIHPNNRVKAITVIAYVDKVPYGKLYSDKDNAMNGGLGVGRAMAVFSVIRNYADLHDLRLNSAFVRCKKEDPKCRGIEISFHREPFCSQKDLNSAKKILREFNREPTIAYVADGSSDPQKVVLLCKKRVGGKVQTSTKTCLAAIRKPCPAGTIWDDGSGKCERICKGNFVWNSDSKRCECPACPEGQHRNKQTCSACVPIVDPPVDGFKPYFTISAGLSNASLCPEGTGRNVQGQARASLHLHENFALNGGIATAGMLMMEGSDIKVTRGIFLSLGAEGFLSTKIQKKKLDFGLRGKFLLSTEAQYPVIEGFVRLHFTKKYFLEAQVNSLFYTPVDPNTGRAGDTTSSINIGASVGFRF